MAADEPSAPRDEYRHSVAPFDKSHFQRAAFCGVLMQPRSSFG
jgi:hypothetical protein